MFILKKHIRPKIALTKFNYTRNDLKKRLLNSKSFFLQRFSIHDSFDFYTVSESYKTKHKYLILAITLPIIASSGALLINDFINMTFNPYTIKTNINSFILVTMYIKGLAYRFLLENSLESKAPTLFFFAFSSLLLGLGIANLPLNHFVFPITYGMFVYFALAPFRFYKFKAESIALMLALLLIFLSIVKNYKKWLATIRNEGKLDEAIKMHMLSDDSEFAKVMDDYVRYLQQWEINLFSKK
jgi:hypothetical protein